MIEFTETKKLIELVDYQNGSVVSRTIVYNPNGNLTLFAFDQGQGLSEHTAPFDAVVCIIDGKAEVVIAGVCHSMQPGEMIIMPANKPHSLRAVERFKMMLVMIKS